MRQYLMKFTFLFSNVIKKSDQRDIYVFLSIILLSDHSQNYSLVILYLPLL